MNSGHIRFVYLLLLYTKTCGSSHSSALLKLSVSGYRLCDHKTFSLKYKNKKKRVDGSEDFYRNWTDYKTGFGNLSGEFWLGLDKIHRLSASGQNVLRVDLESFENETAYAVYESFSMGNESEVYILNVGNYS
ncbi:Hypothetical predicted protein, partial [Paramuricea clavata]